MTASIERSGKRREFVGCGCSLCGQNPDLGGLGVGTPVERRNAASQTLLRMDGLWVTWCGIRSTLEFSWGLLN